MATLDELMRQVAGGSESAMADLMAQARYPLQRRAELLMFDRARAAEVVQSTFVAVWRGRQTYDSSRPAWPWLLRILRSKCDSHWRSLLRRRGREETLDPRLEYAGYVPTGADPATRAEHKQLCQVARELLVELSPGIRDVVLLTVFRDLSDSEVVDILGIPLGTVKSRKSRGLSHIRKRMNEKNREH